eukprot:Sspe_Gene.59400::Locus_32621_Transcript_1_1_Confidence_1.000_Length_1533::g.59400::m.59400
MFGSFATVAPEEQDKEKDRKQKKREKKLAKKERKKEKKRRKEKKQKRDGSSSDSGSSSGDEPAAKVVENERRKEESGWMVGGESGEDEFMKLLLGGGGGADAQPESRVERILAARHGAAPKRQRDAADLFDAGLQGRFQSASEKTKELDQPVAGTVLNTDARVDIRAHQAMLNNRKLSDVVNEDGEFEGRFIPPHLRDMTVGELQERLTQTSQPKHKKKKKEKKQDDRFTEYEGIGRILEEKKEEMLKKAKGNEQKDARRATGRGCPLSYGSERFSRENLVAMGERTLLMLPVFAPLCVGHCYLTTIEPRSTELSFDEDESREIRNFKKCLMQMAAEKEESMLFCEQVMNLHQQRQTYIECIPLPNEVYEDCELALYKALDEAESEFVQNHKRVISTKGKPLRQCLNKAVAYFHVSFGLEGGFAHVIAEEHRFPDRFAVDICGNLLGVGMGGKLSRRQREDLLGASGRKKFRAIWDAHDWTKMLDV